VYVNLTMSEDPAVVADTHDDRLPHERLTQTELQVFLRIARGQSVGEIAATLGLNRRTISTHRKHILIKMDSFSDFELMRYGIRQRLAPSNDA
jgi:DNA-binding CsgD family transcriptional regulator